MSFLLRRLIRSGTLRGLAGEHWTWFVIAVCAWLVRRARRDEPAPLIIRPIEAGEHYELSLVVPPTRRQARRAGSR